MVTVVPPAAGPEIGEMLLTVIEDVPKLKALARVALAPSGLVTATLTDPAACPGVVALSWVELTKETLDAGLPPKETVAPLVKLDPVTVTVVPPVVAPEFGETLLMVGEVAVYVKALARDDDLPSAVVTCTLTFPVVCGGTMALN
jgi:hypothetical protein